MVSISSSQAADFVRNVDGVPTLPPVVDKLSRLLMNPNVPVGEVARLLMNDPALASRLLRIVNSALYSIPSRVASVQHAIIILGFNATRNMLMGSEMVRALRPEGRENRVFMREIWEHSIVCGIFARILALRKFGFIREDVFVSGLLHDLGKVILLQNSRKTFVSIMDISSGEGVSPMEAEKQALGFTHAEIGAALLEKWRFPEILTAAVRFHHNPRWDTNRNSGAAFVHMGDILARSSGLGPGREAFVPDPDPETWGQLGLGTTSLPQLYQEVEDMKNQVLGILGI